MLQTPDGRLRAKASSKGCAGELLRQPWPLLPPITLEDGCSARGVQPVRKIDFYSDRHWVPERCRAGDGLTGAVYETNPGWSASCAAS